jgi:hypothetical protein
MKSLLRYVAMVAFSLLASQIEKIKHEPLQFWLNERVGQLRKVFDIFTDDDKNDQAQLQKWWEENQDQVVNGDLDTAIQIVRNQYPDPEIRQQIINLIELHSPRSSLLA